MRGGRWKDACTSMSLQCNAEGNRDQSVRAKCLSSFGKGLTQKIASAIRRSCTQVRNRTTNNKRKMKTGGLIESTNHLAWDCCWHGNGNLWLSEDRVEPTLHLRTASTTRIRIHRQRMWCSSTFLTLERPGTWSPSSNPRERLPRCHPTS